MKITLGKRLCLTAMLALGAIVYTASASAETSKLIIESGDSANVNAYWEPNPLRCLDRSTGRTLNP